MIEESTRQFIVNYWIQNFKQKEKIIEASKISSDLNTKNSYKVFLVPPAQNFDINTYGSSEMSWNLSQFNFLLGFTFKVMIPIVIFSEIPLITQWALMNQAFWQSLKGRSIE